MNLFDKAFGLSPQVLSIRSERFELIAANLANADTPGYKAVDLDFKQALARTQNLGFGMERTHDKHITVGGLHGAALYRVPAQASLDGNTVETDQEHAAFMDNAIRYQASLNFLDGRVKGILLALRGE